MNGEREKLLITSAEVARLLGISQRHLANLVKDGKLPPPIRLGYSVRWSLAAIERSLGISFALLKVHR